MNSLFVVPRFELTIVENIAGMLEVRWIFAHTGGLTLQFLSVRCSSARLELSNVSLCTPMTACGNGITRVGPIVAGNSYTCTVNASNAVGSTASNTSTIKAFTGERRYCCYIEEMSYSLFDSV